MKLLDSNVFIGAAAFRDDTAIPAFLGEPFSFSVITRIEVLGFHKLGAEEKQKLVIFLAAGEELPLTDAIAGRAIDLRQARRLSWGDSINAATALWHDLPLMTYNLRDFSQLEGLRLNPVD